MEKMQSIAYKADHTVINAHKHLRLQFSCSNFFINIVPKAELTLMLTMRDLGDEKGEKEDFVRNGGMIIMVILIKISMNASGYSGFTYPQLAHGKIEFTNPKCQLNH